MAIWWNRDEPPPQLTKARLYVLHKMMTLDGVVARRYEVRPTFNGPKKIEVFYVKSFTDLDGWQDQSQVIKTMVERGFIRTRKDLTLTDQAKELLPTIADKLAEFGSTYLPMDELKAAVNRGPPIKSYDHQFQVEADTQLAVDAKGNVNAGRSD